MDLMEISPEFLQEEVLRRLLRETTSIEQEALEAFALERKLATLLVTLDGGIHPWSWYACAVASQWRASLQVKVVPAPAGFASPDGWWTNASGDASLPPARLCAMVGWWG